MDTHWGKFGMGLLALTLHSNKPSVSLMCLDVSGLALGMMKT